MTHEALQYRYCYRQSVWRTARHETVEVRPLQSFRGYKKAFGLHPKGFRNSKAHLTALHCMDLLSPYHVISRVPLVASVHFQNQRAPSSPI